MPRRNQDEEDDDLYPDDWEDTEVPEELEEWMEEEGYYDEENDEYDLEGFLDEHPEAYEWFAEDYLDYLDDVPDFDDADFYGEQ